MKKSIQLVLVILGVVLAYDLIDVSSFPDPLLVAEKENLRIDLGQYFHADLVDYSLKFGEGNSELQKYITLPNKYDLVQVDYKPTGPIKYIYTEKDETGQLKKEFGYITGDNTIEIGKYDGKGHPNVKRIEKLEAVTPGFKLVCYDLVYIFNNTWLVDCLELENNGSATRNLWYKLTKQDDLTYKKSPFRTSGIHIDKEKITQTSGRQLVTVKTAEAFYLIRFWKGLANGYAEVYYIGSLNRLWLNPVDVIDKTTLGLGKQDFTIEGIIHWGDSIWILDYAHGPIKVLFSPFEQRYQLVQLPDIRAGDVLNTRVRGGERVIATFASLQYIYTYDWTDINSPVELSRFKFKPVSDILKVDISDRFIVVLVVNENEKNEVQVYRKKSIVTDHAFMTWTDDKEKITDIIFNEINDCILVILETYTKVINLHYPYLQLKDLPLDKPKIEFQLLLSVNQSVIKTQTINVIPYKENDNSVYGKVDTPFQVQNNYPATTRVNITIQTQGPALQYEINKNEQQFSKFKIYTNQNLSFTSDLPSDVWNKDIIYSHFDQGHATSRYNRFYLLFIQFGNVQDGQGTFYVLKCSVDQMQLVCNTIDQVVVNGNITLVHQSKSLFIIKSEGNTNQILAFDNKDFKKQQVLYSGNEVCFDVQVTDSFNEDYLFCSQPAVGTIQLSQISSIGNIQQIKTIIQYNLYSYFGHRVEFFRPEFIIYNLQWANIIFVKNVDHILVLSLGQLTSRDVRILAVIKSENIKGDKPWTFAIVGNYLTIISESNQKIEEWDINDLFNIIKRRNYPMYDYKFSAEYDSYDSSIENSFFMLQAIKEGTQENNILIFNSKAYGSNLLYQTIPVPSSMQQQQLRLHSGQISNEFEVILLVSKKQIQVYKAYIQPVLEVESNWIGDIQSAKALTHQQNIQIYNRWNTDKKVEHKVQVDVLNVGSRIIKKADDYTSKATDYKDFNNQQQILRFQPENYFKGHVQSYQIDCEDKEECQNNRISVLNKVELHKKYFNLEGQYITDLIATKDTLYVQTQNRLFLYNIENDEVTNDLRDIVELGVTNSQKNSETYNCRIMIVDPSLLFTLHGCEDLSNFSTQIVVVSHVGSEPRVFYSERIFFKTIHKMEYIDNYLFVLVGDRITSVNDNKKILLLRIDFRNIIEGPPIKQILVIEGDSWGTKQLESIDISVKRVLQQPSEYMLVVSDAEFGVRVAKITIDLQSQGNYRTSGIYSSIDLNGVFKNEKQLSGHVLWQNIELIKATTEDIRLFITSKNFNHYEFIYNFQNKQIKVTQALAQLGNYSVSAEYEFGTKYIALKLQRSHIKSNEQDLVVIYPWNENAEANDNYELTYIQGATEIPPRVKRGYRYPTFTFLKNNELQTRMWVSVQGKPHSIEEYKIHKYVGLILPKDWQNLKTKSVTFSAKNAYSVQSIILNNVKQKTQDTVKPGESEKKPGLSGWWIFLIVILSLIFVALLYVTVRKQMTRNQSAQEFLLPSRGSM